MTIKDAKLNRNTSFKVRKPKPNIHTSISLTSLNAHRILLLLIYVIVRNSFTIIKWLIDIDFFKANDKKIYHIKWQHFNSFLWQLCYLCLILITTFWTFPHYHSINTSCMCTLVAQYELGWTTHHRNGTSLYF